MTIKELHKQLSDIIEENSEYSDLPVRLELTDDEKSYEQSINYWLTGGQLYRTVISGHEEEGELKLI